MKDMILLVLGFVLINNLALTQFLGLTPLLGFAKKGEKILALGLSVTVVTLLTSLALWLLRGVLPVFLQLFAGVALSLVFVYLLQLLLAKKLGIYFPVIALNAAVMGIALQTVAAEEVLGVILSALGAGLGFLFGLFLLTGVEKKIESDHLPRAFQGFPIQILAAAIVALALTAFSFK